MHLTLTRIGGPHPRGRHLGPAGCARSGRHNAGCVLRPPQRASVCCSCTRYGGRTLRRGWAPEQRRNRALFIRAVKYGLEGAYSAPTPPSLSTGPTPSSGEHSFHFKCHVPNCTLHQIVLNGIQTNFNVVPTFSLCMHPQTPAPIAK